MNVSPAMAQDDGSTVTWGTAYNPLSTYSDFNVVSLGDLHIVAESEGPVAVGGQFSFDGSQTIVKKSGVPAGLVVKGGIDWANSTGQHQVNQTNGNVTGEPLSVNLNGSEALDKDGNGAAAQLQLVPEGTDYDNQPGIKVNDNGPQAENAGYDADKFDALFDENAAIGISEELDAQAESTCQEPNVIKKMEGENNLPEGTELPAYFMQGNQAWIWLKEGQQNILNLTAEELAGIGEFQFRDGVQPSASTPLFINVSGEDVTVDLRAGNGETAPYTLWNFADATKVTQAGDTIEGSVLAPKAHLDKQEANIEGNIIVASGEMRGSEQHHFEFAGEFTPCGDDEEEPEVPSVDPAIGTSAEVTEGAAEDAEKTVSRDGGVITDTVTFGGLKPETEYTMSGELQTAEGESTGITTAVTFTTPAAEDDETTVDGSVELTYEISAEQAQQYAGQSLVVVEQLFLDDELVASHVDLNDKAQTFVIEDDPEEPGEPTDPEDPDSGIVIEKTVTGDNADAVNADEDATFEVLMSWEDEDGVEQFKKVTVTPGEPVDVSDLPVNTEITLTESNASTSANGVKWADIIWSGEGVTDEPGTSRQGTVVLKEGEITEVSLENVTDKDDKNCLIIIPIIPIVPIFPVTPIDPNTPEGSEVTYPSESPSQGGSTGSNGSNDSSEQNTAAGTDSQNTSNGGGLANTGASVIGLAALALILAGGGAWLMLRNRREGEA